MTSRFTHLRGFALALIALLGLAAAPGAQAQVRTGVAPYLEVQQVLNADLNGGEVLTYTAVAAGVDARVSSRRVEAQISYRYEHRISWDDELADNSIHNGLAQVRAEVLPGTLQFNAGAIAARGRGYGDGPAFGFIPANEPVLEVFGAYAGPDLSTNVGPVAVTASYRLGYIHIDDHSLAGVPPSDQFVADRYDSSVTHSASASIGMAPGELPFGWTVGAGYAREDTDRLDQTFEGKFVRGDVVVPVGSNLALTAGVGYEEIQSSQQDILRSAGGVPILTPGGELIADPGKPRLLAYDQSGLIWDAGVIYRPNRRTELQARVGQRYGGTTVTGSLRHQINSAYSVRATVYDSVSSFGRLVLDDLNGLPTDFNVDRNPFGQGIGGIGGCVFGADPGSGVCFDDALQTITAEDFRARGANIIFSGGRGPWSTQIGASYSRRNYFEPTDGLGFGLAGITDERFTFQSGLTRALSSTSSLGLDAYASWFGQDRPGSDDVYSTGITGSYYQSFLFERLQGQAAIGLFHTDTGLAEGTTASALVGLRYTFR